MKFLQRGGSHRAGRRNLPGAVAVVGGSTPQTPLSAHPEQIEFEGKRWDYCFLREAGGKSDPIRLLLKRVRDEQLFSVWVLRVTLSDAHIDLQTLRSNRYMLVPWDIRHIQNPEVYIPEMTKRISVFLNSPIFRGKRRKTNWRRT